MDSCSEQLQEILLTTIHESMLAYSHERVNGLNEQLGTA